MNAVRTSDWQQIVSTVPMQLHDYPAVFARSGGIVVCVSEMLKERDIESHSCGRFSADDDLLRPLDF